MNIQKFEKAQDRLTAVVFVAGMVAWFFGADYYGLAMANDLSGFGEVAYPIILAVSAVVAITALAVKAYGYRLAKTYR
jgi:hypothetical protein